MTNHWSDIANATLVLVWGANPSENHPACMAHINRARFPKQYFPGDTRANKTAAKLIVIDPRKTRTAAQADLYVRIRPGTDIAFGNGLLNYMTAKIEGLGVADPINDHFFKFLNYKSNGTFFTDGDATSASTSTTPVPNQSKYTDARFILNASGTDYDRETIVAATGLPVVGGELPSTTIKDFPKKASTADGDPNTVYNRMKAHVAAYTLAVTADICGCTAAEIAAVGDAIIENSRCASYTGAGTLITDPRDPGYRATTMLYAMGITQHTCGGQNVKIFAQVATLMGNMGRAGGGINALRGIHNVQGSTDMGLLYGNIPGYSGNPTEQFPAVPNAFGRYVNSLWGNPVSGTGTRAQMNGSYDDSYNTAAMALQQRGFYNMTLKWFGDYAYVNGLAGTGVGGAKRDAVDKLYSLWPKGQGDNHITMFRNMGSGSVKAAFVLGQNPAVTEPNQSKVRDGLKNLDTLVVVDMFETETAACDRKLTGVTYLIPAAAHVEKAGSATNSGRTLQWRYQARTPAGNSKDDIEVLLRFAKALNDRGAFAHISSVWSTIPGHTTGDVYTTLYGTPYGYTPGATAYNSVPGTVEICTPRTRVDGTTSYANVARTGSEVVADKLYQEICLPVASGGCMWIYTSAYEPVHTTNKHTGQADWAVNNRAKSRDRSDPNATLAFPGWGYSWLVNRRVLYNNADVPGDVTDYFMGPDSAARLFVSTSSLVLNYSRWYRTVHKLSDKPDVVLPATINAASPHFVSAGLSYAGRFPAHVEPYETPRADLAVLWGRNTKGGAAYDLVPATTQVAGRDVAAANYPLVLTTIRCVEHFQGGPITRNNPYNVEAEPEPWIELNSVDARAAGVVDGDWVKIVTARTESFPGGMMPNYGQGFRARVGVGLQSNQRVAPGVVGIPWHWGEKGLSTGSRANDLTIDAMDANTTIPEYKACLCRIEKM